MAKTASTRKAGRSKTTRAAAGRAKKSTSRSAKSTKSTRGAAKATRGRKRAGAAKAAKTAKRGGGGRGTANAAFMRPVSPSPSLAQVVGEKPIPRSEVTKRLWAYIKKNRLQDQENRRMINADDALKPVFGGKSTVNMFEMTKLVNKQLK